MSEVKTKQYEIVINGVKESVDAVESLNKSLEKLEERFKTLEDKLNLNIKVNTPNIEQELENIVTSPADDVKKQDNRALEEADKLQRDILATEEKLAEVRDENYQKLLHMKEQLKEYNALAKAQAAADENRQGLFDTNTMFGIKGQLKSIKTEMQILDIDSNRFRELTQQANELNNKLKEIEQGYGQYGRNVGNYANSMAEGLQQVKIKVGDTERTFVSAMEAARVLNKELKSMAVNGQQNTKKYQDLDEAVKQLNSTLKDVGASSVVMDNLLDTMQGVTAIASASQGFSAFFGFDNTQIEKSIQKLVALQNVLQGIEVIKKQMKTGEGIGGVLSKGYERIDTMTFKLKRMNVSMLGTGKAAHVAAIGIKAMSTALKGLTTLGLAVLLDLLVEGIQKVAELVGNWVKGDSELINSTDATTSAVNKQNDELQKNLELIKKREEAGDISITQARTEAEKAYAKALLESRNAMLKREDTYRESGIVQSGKTDLYLGNAIGDKGVTTLGGFKEEIQSIDDFTKRFDYLMGRVENGKDITDSWKDTASDARDELVHMTKLVGGDFVNAMNKYANGTAEGTRALAEYIAKMDTLTSGKYSQSIKLGIDKGYLDSQFAQAWNLYQNFKTDVVGDPIRIKLDFENLANQIIDASDKFRTSYYNREREKLKEQYNRLSKDEQTAQKGLYDKAMASLDKQEKDTRQKVLEGDRRTADERTRKAKENQKKVLAAENELTRLRIEQMKDGLRKTITQLEEERKAKLAKIKTDGVMVGQLTLETNQLYDKKVEDARRKHGEELIKIQQDVYKRLLEDRIKYVQRYQSLASINEDNSLVRLNKFRDELYNQSISSYGIQGKNQYSSQTRQRLGIISEERTEIVEEYKKLIDVEQKYNEEKNKLAVEQELISAKILKAEGERTAKQAELYKELEDLEKRHTSKTKEEYVKLRDLAVVAANDISGELENVMKKYNDLMSNSTKMSVKGFHDETENLAKQIELYKKQYDEQVEIIKDYQESILATEETYYLSKQIEIAEQIEVEDKKVEALKREYNSEIKVQQDSYNKQLEVYENYKKELAEKYSTEEQQAQAKYVYQALLEENYNKKLSETFNRRMNIVEDYWTVRIENTKANAELAFQTELELEKLNHQKSLDEAKESWNEQLKQLDDYHQKRIEQVKSQVEGEILTEEELFEIINIDREYHKVSEEAFENFTKSIELINEEHAQKVISIENSKNEKIKAVNAEFYQDQLQEYRDFQTALNNLESKQPVKNIWGIVNLKQTNKNNRELQDSYKELAANLANTRKKLNEDYKNGVIDEDVYRSSLRELDSFSADLGDKMDDVSKKLSTFGKIEYLSEGINYWVQAVGQSLNSVLSSLSEITDNYYAGEIEKQQKYIDELQEMYDHQEEITREHADALSAIEDELSTARGDRRQQLIDQLNAEMAAQRASLAQQKKIEAQRKREEEKQKRLEHEQAVAKKRMQEAQAYINMAMSISMAAVNSWPIPAIPMIALATATGAAQIAAIKSQNIPSYGKGGLIEGKSHKQGGVKATLGLQPIELEGNEYIIRKKTTIENLGLLDFVNKSERKLKLEDFIEFYSSNKVRKSVASANPRNKFADGGQVPILRTDIDINNRLLNAFEDYSNRPTVVEVKEILDKTEAVKQVRVLAGLAD